MTTPEQHWTALNEELRWHVEHELDQHADWEVPGEPGSVRAWVNLRRVEHSRLDPDAMCVCLHYNRGHLNGPLAEHRDDGWPCQLCDCPRFLNVRVARDHSEHFAQLLDTIRSKAAEYDDYDTGEWRVISWAESLLGE